MLQDYTTKNDITMLLYDGNTYVYQQSSKNLFILSENGRFERRPDVDMEMTENEINFSSMSRCLGIYNLYDVHIPLSKCQIYDENSRAYQTASGNCYRVDLVKGTISGKALPNYECKVYVDSIKFTQKKRLDKNNTPIVTQHLYAEMPGEKGDMYIETSALEEGKDVTLAEWTWNDLNKGIRCIGDEGR